MSKHVNLAKFENKKKPRYKQRIIFYILIILIIFLSYFFVFQKIYALAIYPRVYCCNNFNLSALKIEQAEALLKIFVEEIESKGFSFYAQTDLGEKLTTVHPQLIALEDPDLSRSLVRFNITATLEKAYSIGRAGNFFQRTLEMLVTIVKDKKIDLVMEINEYELERILRQEFVDLEKPAENVRIIASDGKLVLIDEKPGFVLDYATAIEDLRNELKHLNNNEIKIATILQTAGIRAEEISAVFSQAQDIFDSAPYVLTYQDKEWTLQAGQIAPWFTLLNPTKSEFRQGRNYLTGFKVEKKDSEQIILSFEQEKILTHLEDIAQEINIQPVGPRLTVENGRVIEFQIGQPGLILDMEKSSQIIVQGILNKLEKIELKTELVNPVPLPQDIDSLGIKELIGTGMSNFAGSPKNRRHNIAVGAEKLHGILIKPDEEFSLIKALGSIDEENGFLPELVIKGDRTIPEYGGGLCQIGTTTFRTAINTGLPITERQSHSYRVVYYEPAGMDATIYSPKPDFKFINDTGHHILFQTKIKGNDLIFKFYGTSDSRIVETSKPEIFNITKPGPPRLIETDELEPGEKEKVESAHSGADAEFKNIITFANGIIKEEIWKSHYRPWPEVWMVGREVEDINNESTGAKSEINN